MRGSIDKAWFKTTAILLVFLAVNIIGKAQLSSPSRRLNVIVILTDDQGYGDFSSHGNPVLQTPALDKLRDESIRFSNFHVTPLCTPTRGQLLTGLDALDNGAMTVGTGRNILRRDIITMPEIFKQNGYETGIFGKWHLGDNYPDRPMDRGFKKCIWFKGWGLLSESEFDNDYYKTRYLDGIETKYSNQYCTDLWFGEAMNWMGEMAAKKKPFFVYLPTNAPHGPYYAPPDDYNYYRDQVADSAVAKFYGMIRNIDKNIARLESWLEEKHVKENTVLLFITDNGGTGGVKQYNAGMRGMKAESYDGGHRAACFIKWPNQIAGKPRTIDLATQVQDILPTFIDVLNLKLKKEYRFDGKSLKPAFENAPQKLTDRMFVVQYGGDNYPKKYSGCVVWKSWRLVGERELYDISKDSAQQHNVADDYPNILKKMQGFYEKWWSTTQSEVNTFVPLIIGAEQEKQVILTSDFWADSAYVNTQWKVAQAGGPSKGGVWHIEVAAGGKYKLELSRWPFHLERNLTDVGPDTSIGGTKLRTGKALNIEFGCISLNNREPVVMRKSDGKANKIVIDMILPKGKHSLRAWFKDASGLNVCGAYYLRVKKVIGD